MWSQIGGVGIQNRSIINKIKVRLTKLDVMELKFASKNGAHQNQKWYPKKWREGIQNRSKEHLLNKIKVRATNWRGWNRNSLQTTSLKEPKPQPTNCTGMEFNFALQRASPNKPKSIHKLEAGNSKSLSKERHLNKTKVRATNCRGVDFKNRNRALKNVTQENPSASHKLEGWKCWGLQVGSSEGGGGRRE